jgi:protein-disulfide isomerase
MKTLGLLSMLLLATSCENAHSKLDSSKSVGGGASSEALGRLEERLKGIEESLKIVPGGAADASASERLQRVEIALARYGEALEFLQGVYAQQKQQAEQKEAGEADPNAVFAVDVSGAVKAGQTEGPAGAAVTIVKAFDFACPYCEKLTEPLHELVKEYNGQVRVVYMNLVVHPDSAMTGHLYTCAAAKQGKYVALKDAFWEKSFKPYVNSRGKDMPAMGEENILKYAGGLGLNVQQLKADANSADCKARISADETELRKFRVSGTPGLFINGTFFGGAIPKEAFKQVIDEKLKLVAASKVPPAQYYDKEIMTNGLKVFRSKRDAKNDAKKAGAGSAEKATP